MPGELAETVADPLLLPQVALTIDSVVISGEGNTSIKGEEALTEQPFVAVAVTEKTLGRYEFVEGV